MTTTETVAEPTAEPQAENPAGTVGADGGGLPPGVELVPVGDDPKTNALGVPIFPSGVELQDLARTACTFAYSGLVPDALRGKPNDVFLVLMTGRDLGVSMTTALSLIYPIKGKTTVAPKLRLALINTAGAHKGWKMWPDPGNDRTRATWYATRKDRPGLKYHYTITLDDLKDVADPDGKKLLDKNNWKNWPDRMLSHRCVGFLADDVFPEVCAGLYCVPTRAEALTREGWVTHDKLAIGDEILAYDPGANLTRWVPVRRTVVYPARPTYRLGHARWAFTTTPDHRWFIQRKGWPSNRDPGREVRTTGDLRPGQGGTLVLAAPSAPGPSALTPRDAAILGWLLTDGCLTWQVTPKGHGPYPQATISQSKYVDAIRSLLGEDATVRLSSPARTQQIRGKDYSCRAGYTFFLRSSFLRPFLARCGNLRAKGDAIQVVTRLDHEARQAMLDAMLLANGHDASQGPTGQRHVGFFTGRRDVLDAFQALCAAHGQALGTEAWDGSCYRVYLRRSHGIEVANLTVQPHAVEDVWCVTTDLGSWVCRLDGVVAVTGNSPDDLGALTDEEGEPVYDVVDVGPYAGMVDKPGQRAGQASGPADGWADREVVRALVERAKALPDGALEHVATTWDMWDLPREENGKAGFRLLTDRMVPQVRKMLDKIEAKARAGQWGPWQPPAPQGSGGGEGTGLGEVTAARTPAGLDGGTGPDSEPDRPPTPEEGLPPTAAAGITAARASARAAAGLEPETPASPADDDDERCPHPLPWKQEGRCAYCSTCKTRLYEGPVAKNEAQRQEALQRLAAFAAELAARAKRPDENLCMHPDPDAKDEDPVNGRKFWRCCGEPIQ